MGMKRNPLGDFLQFLVGGALFSAGVVLLANQVMATSGLGIHAVGRGWGGGAWPIGTGGLGLLMIPLGIGVCLMFAGADHRWANLLVWGSAGALGAAVLNSIRFTVMPTTLWQLLVYIAMLSSGGGLMFRSLRQYTDASR